MLYNITHIMTISIQERTLLLMKIRKYTEARRHYKSGDIVWACAFQRTDNDLSLRYFSKPVKGMLVPYEYLEMCQRTPDLTLESPIYFIPFNAKKHGTSIEDLAWSKAVQLSSRCYADSEQECIDLYNQLIDEDIAFFKKQITEDETHKI